MTEPGKLQADNTAETSSADTVINIPKAPSSRALGLVNNIFQVPEDRSIDPLPKNNKSYTIYRLPDHIRKRNVAEGAIKPRVVPIGPFFHGDPDFVKAESEKDTAMHALFGMCRSTAEVQYILSEKIKGLVARARESYSENLQFDDNKFIEMLVKDSCFIISFLISITDEVHETPISFDWDISEIRSDLLLLENQIPLFVVCEVYDAIQSLWRENKLTEDFNYVVRQIISVDMPWGFPEVLQVQLSEVDHLLHYCWLCFLHKSGLDLNQAKQRKITINTIPVKTLTPQYSKSNWLENIFPYHVNRDIPTATELHKVAGVEFKNRSPNEICVAKFRSGNMKMPSLKINESMKIILVNLIGFEKSYYADMRPVSSYVLLMDSLINIEEDVKLLQGCSIIVNGLSTYSLATIFFNEIGDICKVNYRKHLYADLFNDVNKYYKSKWKRRQASLRQEYFKNPWAGIAVFAAGFLLILAVIQTILAGVQTYYTIHPLK